MRKKNFLFFFLVLGIFALLLQVLLLLFMTENDDSSNEVLYSDIKTLLSVASSLRVPLILIEPFVLKSHEKDNREKDGTCKHFCQGRKVVTFAVLQKSLSRKETLMRKLVEHGFQQVVMSGPNPLKVSDREEEMVPYCYFFRTCGAPLELIVFYEREGNFWWHGNVQSDPEFGTKLSSLGMNVNSVTFGQYAGVYDKFERKTAIVDGLSVHMPANVTLFLEQVSESEYIECNYARARKFSQQYGKDNSAEAIRFRHKAWKLLSKVKTLLDTLGVRFWLSSGTCLGFYRECDIIPYARDVDIGIWIKDYDARIISEFSKHSLLLKHKFGKHNDSLELSFQESDIKLDIFFFYEEGDIMWNGGTQAKTGKKFKYIFPKFTLCWTEFLELKVRVPCETQAYIEANYGGNWFEPVWNWDWKSSPPNVRENGEWPVQERPEVIQLFDYT